MEMMTNFEDALFSKRLDGKDEMVVHWLETLSASKVKP
jgi:hypothetical protein